MSEEKMNMEIALDFCTRIVTDEITWSKETRDIAASVIDILTGGEQLRAANKKLIEEFERDGIHE